MKKKLYLYIRYGQMPPAQNPVRVFSANLGSRRKPWASEIIVIRLVLQ